jgi:hypothetical protein
MKESSALHSAGSQAEENYNSSISAAGSFIGGGGAQHNAVAKKSNHMPLSQFSIAEEKKKHSPKKKVLEVLNKPAADTLDDYCVMCNKTFSK